MLRKRLPGIKPPSDATVVALAIAVVSASALVVFAARQSPVTRQGAGRPRLSRAQINAAEERAIWAPPATGGSGQPAVTITGCLERNGDSFRLKDTSGADVPQARSWKFGFLRKGPAPIDLVDAGSTTANHVGERVRVTGVLEDRRLHLRSLNRVADSCS
jgi:hypothetical protein